MKASEFRSNMRKWLDAAVAGQEVYIERGGIKIRLTPEFPEIPPKPAVSRIEKNGLPAITSRPPAPQMNAPKAEDVTSQNAEEPHYTEPEPYA